MSKSALVIGGASCVWDDVRALEATLGREWPGITIAANDVGSHWPRRLDHWVTLHPERLQTWMDDRTWRGYPDGYVRWAQKRNKRELGFVDRVVSNYGLIKGSWILGNSGYAAIGVAKEVGCTHVVLCGVPLTTTPHFAESTFHDPAQKWTGANVHWPYWKANADTMLGWVKSMSGNTRELLGAPTLEWLNGSG